MESKRIKFTVATLSVLPLPAAGQRDTYHDLKESGLSLRVGPSGKMQFSVLKRVKNGQPMRVTLGAFPDLSIEQARAKAMQIKNSIALGEDPAEALREKRKEMTLGLAFDWYLENHAVPNSLKTIDVMRGNFERYLGALPDAPRKKHGRQRVKAEGSVNWQNKRLSSIRPSDVAQLKASLAKHSGKASANHALKLLRTVFNVLIRARVYMGTNPAADLGVLKIQDRARFLLKEELQKLLTVLDETTNTTARDFILLSIFTGARKTNVLSMCWADVNFDLATWTIPDTKNGESVIVQLPAEAIEVLRTRQQIDKIWVFPGTGETGHLLSPKRGVSTIFKQAGITDLRIHDLRRTMGSWQAILGSSLLIIGKSLGHRSMASTLIYARLTAEPVRESVKRASAAMNASRTVDALPTFSCPSCTRNPPTQTDTSVVNSLIAFLPLPNPFPTSHEVL